MGRNLKLAVWGAAVGLLPFVVFIGAESYRSENGEITSYNYLNLAAIAGGIAAVVIAIAMLRGDSAGDQRRPGWVMAVCAALVVLGAFQVVRGIGLLPGMTGCTSESGSAGFCKATNI